MMLETSHHACNAPKGFAACRRDDNIDAKVRSQAAWTASRLTDNRRRNSMARKHPRPEVSRRKFLAGVAVAGAATAVTPPAARAATTASTPASAPPRRPSALPPTMQVAVAETATPKELPRIGGVPGSDFMVDVIKTLDIKYVPSNCASSFRGHPRVADQLRRQQDAGVPHLHARGIRRSAWRTATSRSPASR